MARNFLRAVASGSGCYIHVVENTARNVKDIAVKKGEIKGLRSLDRLAKAFGIEEEDSNGGYEAAYRRTGYHQRGC